MIYKRYVVFLLCWSSLIAAWLCVVKMMYGVFPFHILCCVFYFAMHFVGAVFLCYCDACQMCRESSFPDEIMEWSYFWNLQQPNIWAKPPLGARKAAHAKERQLSEHEGKANSEHINQTGRNRTNQHFSCIQYRMGQISTFQPESVQNGTNCSCSQYRMGQIATFLLQSVTGWDELQHSCCSQLQDWTKFNNSAAVSTEWDKFQRFSFSRKWEETNLKQDATAFSGYSLRDGTTAGYLSGRACWFSAGLLIERLRVRIPAGVAGEFLLQT